MPSDLGLRGKRVEFIADISTHSSLYVTVFRDSDHVVGISGQVIELALYLHCPTWLLHEVNDACWSSLVFKLACRKQNISLGVSRLISRAIDGSLTWLRLLF